MKPEAKKTLMKAKKDDWKRKQYKQGCERQKELAKQQLRREIAKMTSGRRHTAISKEEMQLRILGTIPTGMADTDY